MASSQRHPSCWRKTMKHIEYKPFFAALLALTVIGMAASLATLGVRADDNEAITFRTQLTGFGEVPPKLADGSGTFSGKLSADGQSLSWTLTWTGLTGPALVAHIHFGQPQNTGMPVVFFCGAGKPACPGGATPGNRLSIGEGTCLPGGGQ